MLRIIYGITWKEGKSYPLSKLSQHVQCYHTLSLEARFSTTHQFSGTFIVLFKEEEEEEENSSSFFLQKQS